MTNIKAVVFDAFGTLVRFNHCRTKPYSQLLQWLNRLGRPSSVDDSHTILTRPMGLIATAQYLELSKYASALDPTEVLLTLARLETDLTNELMQIELYPESVDALLTLKDLGLKIGVCSNLAQPYAIPVRAMMPFELDSYSWSFEVGHLKPEHQIYKHACDTLQLPPNEILFVGDTMDCDVTGPCKYGMHSIQLRRGIDGNNLYDAVDIVRKHLKWKKDIMLE